MPAGAGSLPAQAFKLIVDRSAHGFAVIATDGTVVYAGGSMDRVTGWQPDELLGRNIAEFLPAEYLGRAIEAIGEIERDDPSGAGVPMVFPLTRPDGTWAWTEIGATPLLDVPGVEGIVLRHRNWDTQHFFDEFLTAIVRGDDLDTVLATLGRSIALTVDAADVVVHYGFDGHRFAGRVGAMTAVANAVGDEDGSPWRLAAASGEPVLRDVDQLPPILAASARRHGMAACWCLPLPSSPGLPPATLTYWRPVPGDPLLGHRATFDRSRQLVQLALQRHAEHQRLLHLVRHDALTGVNNRPQFRQLLVDALAVGEPCLALAFCDLDRFKAVNDTYGHLTGDAVLVEVANRLRAIVRAGDEVARIGGDEFTILLRNVPDGRTAHHVGERLLSITHDPIVVGDVEVKIDVSVGIALIGPDDSADTLLRDADQALYAVKRVGGHGVRVAGKVAIATEAVANGKYRSPE
jgi:diguanylate cyclase (GGDEF)-like protein/PAS domain S-box-containing protein